MAFGKQQGHLDHIPTYGGNFVQRAKTRARRPNRGGGGGFYWKNTYKPPEHAPDIIRLIAGEYQVPTTHDGENIVVETMSYVPFKEHHNGQRGAICSAGPLWGSKGKAQPCPACTIFWEDVEERKAKKARGDQTKGPRRMNCRDMFAFNVWDYGLYFQTPDTDRSGQMRINPKTNQPYTSWRKGNPNDPSFAGKPWKHGHLLPWSMGSTYFDTLTEWSKQIGACCKSCGSMHTIRTTMKICGNPQCGQYIYDPNNCTLSTEQREQIDYYPYTCQHCQQTAYVSEVIDCANCQTPARATLFDVDLQVQRLGTAGQQTFLQIFSFSEPRPIQVQDPEVLKNIKPLDLTKKFAPTTPEAQYKLFNIPPPVAAPHPMMQPPAMGAPGMPAPMQPPMAMQPQPQPPMAMQPMAQPMQQPAMVNYASAPTPQALPPRAPQPVQPAQPMLPGVQPSPQPVASMGYPAAPAPPMAPQPPVTPAMPQAPQAPQPPQGAVAYATQAATQMPAAVPYQPPQPGTPQQQ